MCRNDNVLEKNTEIKESTFARAANRWSWIPLIGLLYFFIFTSLAFLQFNKGRHGFYLIRKAFFKVILITICSLLFLIYWSGLPEVFYPDIIFKRHGVYIKVIEGQIENHYYSFNNLFKKNIYFTNSNIKSEENLLDGRRHGNCTWWYRNGQKKLTINYENGITVGYQAAWYKNGQLEYEGSYKGHKCFGQWQGWYENGKKSWIAEFDNNGKLSSDYIVWHENGMVALEGQYNAGEEVGKWTCYNEDGSILWQSKNYKQSKPTQHFSSSANILFKAYNTENYAYSDWLGSTPTDSKVQIPSNMSWQAIPYDCNTLEEFKYILNEMRRKHITNVSFSQIGTRLSDLWLTYLTGMSFNTLYLNNISNITNIGLSHLKSLPLKELSLSKCKNINNEGLSHLKYFPINKLNLSENYESISDSGLLYIKDLPLKYLDLGWNSNVTNKGLSHIKSIPLRWLVIRGCSKITDSGLTYLNDSLETLNISNSTITDKGLSNLKKLSLKKLYLYDSDKITDEGISFLKNLPLEQLELRSCNNISKQYQKHFKDSREIKKILEECYTYSEKKKLFIDKVLENGTRYQANYYKNGQLEFESFFKTNQCYGKWQGWYESGQKFWESQFDNAGKQTNKYIVWHENGKVALEGQYNAGEEVGRWTCYNEDGSINWETEDYKKAIDRKFNSKYDFEIYIKNNTTGKYELFLKTSIKESITLPQDHNLRIVIPYNKDFTEDYFAMIMAELRKKHITNISLSKNNKFIKDLWLIHLKGMPLKELIISSCNNITDFGLFLLEGLPLKTLHLNRCFKISDNGIIYIRNMQLINLNLSGLKITDIGLSYIKNMSLKQLYLAGCNVTDEGLKHLEDMFLIDLDLSSTKITGNGLINLKKKTLEKVDLSNCENITDTNLSFIKNSNLSYLNLETTNVTDAGLLFLQGLPLKYLNLNSCENITDKGLANLKGMPLNVLELSICRINGTGFIHFNGMPLKELNLDGSQNIKDYGLAYLKGLPLKKLRTYLCSGLSEKRYIDHFKDPKIIQQILEEVSKKVETENKSN